MVNQGLKGLGERLFADIFQFPVAQVSVDASQSLLESILLCAELSLKIKAFLAQNVKDGIEAAAHKLDTLLNEVVLLGGENVRVTLVLLLAVFFLVFLFEIVLDLNAIIST